MGDTCSFTNIEHLKEVLFISFREIVQLNRKMCKINKEDMAKYKEKYAVFYSYAFNFKKSNKVSMFAFDKIHHKILNSIANADGMNNNDRTIENLFDECRRLGLIDFPLVYKKPSVVKFDEDELQKEYNLWLKQEEKKEKKEKLDKIKSVKSKFPALFTKQELKDLILSVSEEIDEDASPEDLSSELYTYCKINSMLVDNILALMKEKNITIPADELKTRAKELNTILSEKWTSLQDEIINVSSENKYDVLEKLEVLSNIFSDGQLQEKIDEISESINNLI